jgi:hypothetical protein
MRVRTYMAVEHLCDASAVVTTACAIQAEVIVAMYVVCNTWLQYDLMLDIYVNLLLAISPCLQHHAVPEY